MKPKIITKKELLRTQNSTNKEYINNIIQKIGLLPLSGSELKFNPKNWNRQINIKFNHNCYAYAIGVIRSGLNGKPQPGYFAHYPPLYKSDYECDTFYKRILAENPLAYLEKDNIPCRKSYHKIYLAIDPKEEDKDYHFYRQNKNGYWSHKPGRQDVVNIDANGKKIKNPQKANRKYKYYNYDKSCGYICVNPNMSRTYSKK